MELLGHVNPTPHSRSRLRNSLLTNNPPSLKCVSWPSGCFFHWKGGWGCRVLSGGKRKKRLLLSGLCCILSSAHSLAQTLRVFYRTAVIP